MTGQDSQRADSVLNHVDPLCCDYFLKYHLQLFIKSDLPNRATTNSKRECMLQKVTWRERNKPIGLVRKSNGIPSSVWHVGLTWPLSPHARCSLSGNDQMAIQWRENTLLPPQEEYIMHEIWSYRSGRWYSGNWLEPNRLLCPNIFLMRPRVSCTT